MKVSWAAARVNAGMKQEDVAKEIGVSPNTLIEWEKYRKAPTVIQAEKLCKLYGCTMDDISFA